MKTRKTVWLIVASVLLVTLIFTFGCGLAKKSKKVESKPTVTQPPPLPPPPPPLAPKPPEEPVIPLPPPAPPVEDKPGLPPPPEPPQAIELMSVYFAFDKADLTSATIATLNKNVAMLKANPVLKVVVEGHCDERGTVEYNLALGERRAKAVQEYY
ncbi:MAG: OmpA family protein, partial [bacterium]|nr:OmpA family protein [bacterium]